MLINIIIIILALTIVNEAQAAFLPTDTNKKEQVSSTNINALKSKLIQFQSKYNATLLNASFLPFVNDCNGVLNQLPIAFDKRICITYYDMIFNIYDSNDFVKITDVTETLKHYDLKIYIDTYCEDFLGELKTDLEDQPFANATNIRGWLNANECSESCMKKLNQTDSITGSRWRINNICKLISDGLRKMDKSRKKEPKEMEMIAETEPTIKSVTIANATQNETKTNDNKTKNTEIDKTPTSNVRAQEIKLNASEPIKQEETVAAIVSPPPKKIVKIPEKEVRPALVDRKLNVSVCVIGVFENKY